MCSVVQGKVPYAPCRGFVRRPVDARRLSAKVVPATVTQSLPSPRQFVQLPAARQPLAPLGRFGKSHVDFMLTGWQPKAPQLAPIANLRVFQTRRASLSKAFPKETLIIPTGRAKVRSNDTFYPFRPGSDFYYLTGNLEQDCVLVLEPQAGGGHSCRIFTKPNPARTTTQFFADADGEFWVGPRQGIAVSCARYGLQAGSDLAQLPAWCAALKKSRKPYRVLRTIDPTEVDARLPGQSSRDSQLAAFLHELRLAKDPTEIAALEEAVAITQRGFEDVIRALPNAQSERDIEGAFAMRARKEGNGVGYGTIAASGAHACMLHWTDNSGALQPNSLVLLDAGAESNSLYTADVTRTFPRSGKFTPAQRAVYDIVYAAQQAAFAQVKPGANFMAPHRAAMQVLTAGLVRLGVLRSVDEAMQPNHAYYRRYALHNVSHMLGLDVHDCAHARACCTTEGTLRSGMTLTVEPGLYFQPDDLTVPVAYRGIGVRIEDDLLVTEQGYRLLSNLPRQADEVEKWMRTIWKSPPP